MAKLARTLVTGLAIAGVAYVLNPKRDALRRELASGDIDRWRGQLGQRLDEVQRRYGPTLRKAAVAAGFMPGLKFRWRVLAAGLPQIMEALQRATDRGMTARPRARRA
jgi:hypothetical protein